MTQHFDFVALGWVEKYLREEMNTAKSHLHVYQREPDEMRHLREALRNVHSATGVLKLCALDPAALLTQEIERVIGQLIVGKIAGEARRLAMTELAAAMEALPAYLANVRAKREVSAGAIANVINDLRHFGNRPTLPDSLFFNPPVKPSAGISAGKQPAEEAKLKQFAARAMRICAQHSKGALKKERESLKQMFAVGKHATPLLAGSQMEAYFRCHMGLIEALAQPQTKSDEVVVDIFKNTFAFLKSLALGGERAVEEAAPAPYIKKMLYYIAKAPTPTKLQQSLRDAFDVHDVDDVGVASAGRLIQEDDLLEALNHTMSQLLEVMEFMTSQHREISSANSVLVNTIVPKMKQVGLQLKAIGLNTHAESISEQHDSLKALSERDETAEQSELLEFGGALVAVKESLEHKLKHGLSAEGDSMGHDLDSAIMAQTFRCLSDMKGSINREFARRDLGQIVAGAGSNAAVSVAELRPVHRAASLVEDDGIQESVAGWEAGELPERAALVTLAEQLLEAIPENAYAEQAAADMEQVVSVLSLMEDKQRESQILNDCIQFIRDSVGLGGLINDAGMACFAEAIAALEQFMERRTEDPLGNADDHLDRAEARSRKLSGHIEARASALPTADDVVAMGSGSLASANIEDIEIDEAPAAAPIGEAADEALVAEASDALSIDADTAPVEQDDPFAAAEDAVAREAESQSVSMDLEDADEDVRDAVAAIEASAAENDTAPVAKAPVTTGGTPWREALEAWQGAAIDRDADAPLENPDADIDEELVECFVEEARKYIRKLEDTTPLFKEELDNEKYILDVRAVFHTMKGSARTIELHEFGEFMYDMEKVFNSLRDGYIKPTAEIAVLLEAVSQRLPSFIDLMTERVPLYTADFAVVNQIASAISEKRFDETSLRVQTAADAAAPVETAPVETAPVETAEVTDEDADEQSSDSAADALAVEAPSQGATELADVDIQAESYSESDTAGHLDPEDIPVTEPPTDDPGEIEEVTVEGDPLNPKRGGASEPEFNLESEGAEFSEEETIDLGSFDVPSPGDDAEAPDSLSFDASLETNDLLAESDANDDASLSDFSELDSLDEESLEFDSEDVDGALDEGLSDDDLAGAVSVGTLDLSELSDAGGSLEEELLDAELEQGAVEEILDTLDDDLLELDADDAPRLDEATSTDPEPAVTASTALSDAEEHQSDVEPDSGVMDAAAVDAATVETASFEVVDIDEELLEIFLETLDDSIETVDTAASGLDTDHDKSLQKMKNTLHTLKGGANSIGLRNYGALVHDFESAIEGLELKGALKEKEGQSELYGHLDQLHEASQHVKLHQTDWGVMRPSVVKAGGEEAGESEEAEEFPVADRVDSIRVGTNRIDRLLDMGLEVSMSNVRARRALDLAHQDRMSVQSLARRVEEIVDKLSLQLDTEIQAKTEAVPQGEAFDPLEMDRLTEKQGLAAILREAAFDLHEEAKELGEHVNDAMSEAVSSGRLIEGTQSDLRLLRLVAFSRLGPGFRRLVNQVSRQLGKNVEFDLTCDEGGLDVSVFEQVKTALEHMLRNAIDHGIEMPDERTSRGKADTGKVSLIIYRQAAEFVIRLMDDGKGLAPETLRKKAVERGILQEDERISESDALQLIFNSGLSTADKVTDISGRGVGMDVVQQSIAQIGGTVQVSSKPGFYTQFDIRVPASIMVNGALLAAIGDEEVAVPLTSLDGSDFRHRDEVQKTLDDPEGRLTFRNEQYELRYLGSVRSAGSQMQAETMAEFMPVLFARHGRRRVAFFADSVTNAEELVIRSLGAQFTGVPGIAGGSLKPDGQPVLALDLNELIRQVDYADSQSEAGMDQLDNRIVVLCVDDSVMMRRTYEKRLASLNYDVITAEDGEAALDYLAEATRPPDFIFTDLEMPNMNGFDFIANMRRLPVMVDVPTVVVSSRDGDKHRAEAHKVGATDFMAKGANSAEGMQAMIQRYLTTPAMAS